MPQTTVLPDWRATYPIDAPAMKPSGVEVRKSVAISAASWLTGVTTYTVAAHGLPVGSGAYITVQGMTPATFNGQFNANITSATAFTVAMGTTPGTATAFGTAYYMNLASNAIPNAEEFAQPMAVGSPEYTKMLADMDAAKSGKPKVEEEESEEEPEDEGEEEEGEEETEEEEPTPPRRGGGRRR